MVLGHPIDAAFDLGLRVFLATFFVGLAIFYGSKLLAHRVRDGRTPVFGGAEGSAERRRRLVFRAFQALAPIALVVRVFWPELDAHLLPIPPLKSIEAASLGAALFLGGVATATFSHAYMGALWRSGVPEGDALEEGPDALLQRGPFSVSRNPVFLGAMTAQIGFFLLWPTAAAALIAAAGAAALAAQVRVEEAALGARFGASNRAYCARTPRWI